MFLLVSLERVKAALRVTHTDDDAILTIYIAAASRAVLRYLKGQASDVLGIDSPPDSPPNDLDSVPEDVVLAVIMLTGIIYKEPDGDAATAFEQGYLPKPVTALLYPLRDPTLA
jgi:hypothetical protein